MRVRKVTNLEKMKELVGSEKATKEDIISWAYMNRFLLEDLPFEKEFSSMEYSVRKFIENDESTSEFETWEKFLDANYLK